MKKYTLWFVVLLLAVSFKIYSTTWNINVQNFSFNPASLPNVVVGDTVKWTWISGDHHTTTSLTIPAGAPAWDAPLHGGSQTFSYIVTVPGSYQYKCTPHFPGMEGSFTANVIGITPIGNELPQKFNLAQNYPNPFNPVTNIEFDIPKSSFVKLSVMNLLGQKVDVLVDKQLNAGRYNADWDASAYPSGIYFYKLEAEGYVNTKRMILIK
jgi:plastocyanin